MMMYIMWVVILQGEELMCALMECGELSAMISGATKMQQWCVISLGCHAMVRKAKINADTIFNRIQYCTVGAYNVSKCCSNSLQLSRLLTYTGIIK